MSIVVSASGDKTIKIWDVNTGTCLNTLHGHNEVYSIALTPDGTRIVSGSWDKTIKIWDFESGLCLKTLYGHYNVVSCVAICHDGSKIISASDDKTIKIWDFVTGDCINTLTGHTKEVNSIAMSRNDLKLISASSDKSVKIWDFESGECLNTLRGHSDCVNCVAISRDSSTIVSGSHEIKVWNVENGNCINTLTGHTDTVSSIAFTSDGSKIISGSWDKSVKVWSLNSGVFSKNCLLTLSGHTGAVESVAISSDETNIFSGSEDKSIKVWDIHTGQCITTLQGHHNTIYSLAIDPLTKNERQILPAVKISALEQNTERLNAIQITLEQKMNSLQDCLNKALDERNEMKRKQVQHENTIENALTEIKITLQTKQESAIKLVEEKLREDMKSLQEQHEEEKNRVDEKFLDLKCNHTNALEEGKKIKNKQEKYEKSQKKACKKIWKLQTTLKNLMVEKANKNARKQRAQEQVKKIAQDKANSAWDVVAKKAKENVSRAEPSNTVECLKNTMETMPNKKYKHTLEQAIDLFTNMEKLHKKDYMTISPSEFETLEATISSNVQDIQILDASYSECIEIIKRPSDNTDINQRNQTSQEIMTALEKHKSHLETVVAAIDAKIPQLDDFAFEHAEDILKVESALLMNEVFENYIPSIQKWKAIDEELLSWKSKTLTWNNIFSIAPDELETMCTKVKEHRLLPTTIEETAASLESDMKRISTWMGDYVNSLKRKNLESKIVYVQDQIEWVKSIQILEKRTQYHLMPDADVKSMKKNAGHLRVDIQHSEDENERLELQSQLKEILDSLTAMREKNNIFLHEVELAPHQTPVNFPERSYVYELLRSKEQ